MKKLNVYELPLAANVCDQMLREVERCETGGWSMAHVIMNPGAFSLLHTHQKMSEVYIITKGVGILECGAGTIEVQPGNVTLIDPNRPHRLTNTGATSLEHLVIASPAFDPHDVQIISALAPVIERRAPLASLPPLMECFDGAKIIAYRIDGIDLSLAFGFSIADPKRHKPPHYHKVVRERIFVVEGEGAIEINGAETPIQTGDWITIETLERHALRNKSDRYMVVLCMCDPQFDMSDVYFD